MYRYNITYIYYAVLALVYKYIILKILLCYGFIYNIIFFSLF